MPRYEWRIEFAPRNGGVVRKAFTEFEGDDFEEALDHATRLLIDSDEDPADWDVVEVRRGWKVEGER